MTSTLQERLALANQCMAAAQQRQKAYADQKRREVEFKLGQQVLLSSKNIRVRGPLTAKLMPKWMGPYTISKRIGKVAYQLSLPPGMKIHNVFHASLLKVYHSDGNVQPPEFENLATYKINADLEYEVDMILAHRDTVYRKKSVRQYFVQWVGYGTEHNTWEPESELMRKCSTLITAYWAIVKGQSHAGNDPVRANTFASTQDGAKRTRCL